MDVFHVFKIVQMWANRAKRPTRFNYKDNNYAEVI